MKITIYGIYHQDKLIYAGQTKKTLKGRWSDHKSRASTEMKRRTKIYNTIRKYGIDNFNIKSFCVVTEEQADYTEQKVIEIFDLIKNGCNLALGGRVNRGVKKTPEQIEILRERGIRDYKKGIGLATYNGSQNQKDTVTRLRKGKVLPWTPKIAEAKSYGPYEIIIDGVKYIHKRGLNSFAKEHNLNKRSLHLAFLEKRKVSTKGHIVSVSKVN